MSKTWKAYETLGVSRNATRDEIRKKFIELNQKFNPRKWSSESPKDQEWASEKLKEVNDAWNILKDDEQRSFYDHYGDKEWSFNYSERRGLEKYTCSQCKKEIDDNKVLRVQGLRDSFFCSKNCSKKYLDARYGDQGDFDCRGCGYFHPWHVEIPEKCKVAVNAISELEDLDCWFAFTSDEKESLIAAIISSREIYGLDELKDVLKILLKRAKETNEERRYSLGQGKGVFLSTLENLEGWNLLSEEYRREIIENVKKNSSSDQFSRILERVKESISKINKQDKKDRNKTGQIINKIKKAVKKTKHLTSEQKKEFINQLTEIIANGTFENASQKQKAEKLLLELKGEKDVQQDLEISLPKIFGISTVVSLAIFLFLRIITKTRAPRQLKKTKHS